MCDVNRDEGARYNVFSTYSSSMLTFSPVHGTDNMLSIMTSVVECIRPKIRI